MMRLFGCFNSQCCFSSNLLHHPLNYIIHEVFHPLMNCFIHESTYEWLYPRIAGHGSTGFRVFPFPFHFLNLLIGDDSLRVITVSRRSGGMLPVPAPIPVIALLLSHMSNSGRGFIARCRRGLTYP